MAKRDHNLAEREATYFKLKVDEKHCPIEGHFGVHTAEGGIEPHRMRDLFRVMMFLGFGQTLDAPIPEESEYKYAAYEDEREAVSVHIENGQVVMNVHLQGSFTTVRGVVEGKTVTWTGPVDSEDWRAQLDMVEEEDTHPSTRLAIALDVLSCAVKVLVGELIADE